MGDWREKFRMLIAEAAKDCLDRPIQIVPRRASGPRVIPMNWDREEGQALLPRTLPVCTGCQGVIIGAPLPGPTCGQCYRMPPQPGVPELPPAA